MKIKKKILSMIISLGVVLSLIACGSEEKSKETTGGKDSTSIESTSDIEKETGSNDIETTTAQEPTTPEPTIPEPTTQKPTTPEPTTPEPTTQKPTTQKPTTQESTTQDQQHQRL